MQEDSDVINQTWLLIKDRLAAKLLLASNNVCGKGYYYELRKVLIRKFIEVRLFEVHAASCESCHLLL